MRAILIVTFTIVAMIIGGLCPNEASAQNQELPNGTIDWNAPYAKRPAEQFREDGFLIEKGKYEKKMRKKAERLKKKQEKWEKTGKAKAEAKEKKKMAADSAKAVKDSLHLIANADKEAANFDKKGEKRKAKLEKKKAKEKAKAEKARQKALKKNPKEEDDDYDPEITDLEDFGKEGESAEFDEEKNEGDVRQEMLAEEDKKLEKVIIVFMN